MIVLNNTIGNWLGWVDRLPVRLCPKPAGRGRPYVYPTSVLLRCYLLMLLHPRLQTYAALHAFLAAHELARAVVGLPRVPHRTTFLRRFKALEADLKARIWAIGLALVLAGYAETHVLMADGTLHWAAGPSWPAKYKAQGVLPDSLRHVDQHAGWGRSPYHGFVYGYRTHPVFALTPSGEILPLVADVQPADVQDGPILDTQLPWLPSEATALLLDSGYESQDLVSAWERRDENGTLLRWLVGAVKRRRGQPSEWRQTLQVLQHIQEADLYALRGQLVEPFFAHWKAAFDLERVPFQGVAARIYLLLALYAYQLLIWDNLKSGRPTFAYQHLILGLD